MNGAEGTGPSVGVGTKVETMTVVKEMTEPVRAGWLTGPEMCHDTGREVAPGLEPVPDGEGVLTKREDAVGLGADAELEDKKDEEDARSDEDGTALLPVTFCACTRPKTAAATTTTLSERMLSSVLKSEESSQRSHPTQSGARWRSASNRGVNT